MRPPCAPLAALLVYRSYSLRLRSVRHDASLLISCILPGTGCSLAKCIRLGAAWSRMYALNYSRALVKLSPTLRQRLQVIAGLAGLTEVQALELIVEDSENSIDSHLRRMASTDGSEGPGSR